jgi:hypothetical protein
MGFRSVQPQPLGDLDLTESILRRITETRAPFEVGHYRDVVTVLIVVKILMA